jgi:hypothetical protein
MWLYWILLAISLVLLIRVYLLFDIRRRLRRLFISLVNNFEREGVRYWVDFGTLLGLWRGGDIILGDNDADVCVFNDKENIEKVEKVVYEMGGRYLDWGAYRVYDGYLFVDIYVIRREEGTIAVPTGEVIEQELVEPPERIIVKVGTNDVTMHVPRHVNEVLQNRYGNNWGVSRRKWYFTYFDFEKDL